MLHTRFLKLHSLSSAYIQIDYLYKEDDKISVYRKYVSRQIFHSDTICQFEIAAVQNGIFCSIFDALYELLSTRIF